MKVILMSGIPGSGKSTWIKRNVPSPIVCSADHYFMEAGTYQFNPSKLGEAHASCLRKFADSLRIIEQWSLGLITWREMEGNLGQPIEVHDRPTIVVDNTNLSALELAPYVALAAAYEAEVTLVTLHCEADKAHARNVHGVPLPGINRMASALAKRELPPYWNLKFQGEVTSE